MDNAEQTPTESADDPVEWILERSLDAVRVHRKSLQGLRASLKAAGPIDRIATLLSVAQTSRIAADSYLDLGRAAVALANREAPTLKDYRPASFRSPRAGAVISVLTAITTAATALGIRELVVRYIAKGHP